jgi:predicted RND superfamily exporter protein
MAKKGKADKSKNTHPILDFFLGVLILAGTTPLALTIQRYSHDRSGLFVFLFVFLLLLVFSVQFRKWGLVAGFVTGFVLLVGMALVLAHLFFSGLAGHSVW